MGEKKAAAKEEKKADAKEEKKADAKEEKKDDAANVQLKSDPICNSAGCTQYLHPEKDTHPMNYPVPDFGLGNEIKASMSHMDQLEKTMLEKDDPANPAAKKAGAKAPKAADDKKEAKPEADDKTEL